MLKNEKGITLVALMITVIVLGILATITISSGVESVRDTKRKAFYTQMEIIEKRVDSIAATNESYVDSEGNIVDIKEQGTELTEEQKTKVNSILSEKEITNVSVEGFRYFTQQEVETILDISDFNDNLFINFEARAVIADNGVKIGDTTYHMHRNGMYFVEQNTTKNIGTIESLSYTVTPFEENIYKVVVTPSNNVGDIQGTGYVKYKKTTSNYWETLNDTTMIIEPDVDYNIVYTDATGKNSIAKTITKNDNYISLPPEYQQVEYIESTGTQYIDTGIYVTNNTKIDLTMQLNNLATDQKFLGTYGSGGICLGTYSGKWRIGGEAWGGRGNLTFGTSDIDTTTEITNIKAYEKTWIINETTITSIFPISENNQAHIALFAVNVNGSIFQKDSIKVYNLKIYDGDVLVRDFIPCYRKSDNVIGLYDLVNNVFYTNQGTGTFNKGKNINLIVEID